MNAHIRLSENPATQGIAAKPTGGDPRAFFLKQRIAKGLPADAGYRAASLRTWSQAVADDIDRSRRGTPTRFSLPHDALCEVRDWIDGELAALEAAIREGLL